MIGTQNVCKALLGLVVTMLTSNVSAQPIAQEVATDDPACAKFRYNVVKNACSKAGSDCRRQDLEFDIYPDETTFWSPTRVTTTSGCAIEWEGSYEFEYTAGSQSPKASQFLRIINASGDFESVVPWVEKDIEIRPYLQPNNIQILNTTWSETKHGYQCYLEYEVECLEN
eukprot:Clim_evm20s216 gene=Clim_evmTU20s216